MGDRKMSFGQAPPTAPGPRHFWSASLDYWRSVPGPIWPIALAALVLILYDATYFVLARFGTSAKPIVVLGLHLPWITTLESAELFLALGTAALAYAAVEQARAAFAQVDAGKAFAAAARDQARAIHAQTLAQNRPHLAIEVIGNPVLATQSGAYRVLIPGDLLALGEEAQAFLVRNTGPGVAAEIKVDIYGYTPEGTEPKIVRPMESMASVLGPGGMAPVAFPTPITTELWGDRTIVEQFAMLVWATGRSAWPESEADEIPEELTCGALGGVIAEGVYREGDQKLECAWRVLSDDECTKLVNRVVKSKDLPRWPGTLGRRTARFGLGPQVPS